MSCDRIFSAGESGNYRCHPYTKDYWTVIFESIFWWRIICFLIQVKAGHMLKFKSEFRTKQISWHPNSLEFSLFECSRTLWLKLHLQRNGTERAGQRCGQFCSRIVSLSGNIFTILTNLSDFLPLYTFHHYVHLIFVGSSIGWFLLAIHASLSSQALLGKKRDHFPGTQTRGTRLPKVVSGGDFPDTRVSLQTLPTKLRLRQPQ